MIQLKKQDVNDRLAIETASSICQRYAPGDSIYGRLKGSDPPSLFLVTLDRGGEKTLVDIVRGLVISDDAQIINPVSVEVEARFFVCTPLGS